MSSDHWLFGDSTINAIEKIFKNKKVYKPHTVGLGCLQHPNGEEDQNKQTNNDSNEWYTFTFKLSYLLICPFSCLHSAGSCGDGSHASVTNQGHCAPCPFGTYQPDKWQEQCIPCPAGFTTYQRGAASKDLCLRQFSLTMLFFFFKFFFSFFFCIVLNLDNILKTLTLLFVRVGLFWCFCNPPNSDMDHRIFNVRIHAERVGGGGWKETGF